MREITLDVGLACKIKQALSRNGITDVADLDWLATGDNIVMVRQVRLGYAEVTVPEHVIDCDVVPLIPDDWSVEEHRKSGAFRWSAEDVTLYLENRQKNGESVQGYKLRKDLANKPVLNANVLDYLRVHPHLIPKTWRANTVFFWGTIYRDQNGSLYVRSLRWYGNGWEWAAYSLNRDWYAYNPAAVFAS